MKCKKNQQEATRQTARGLVLGILVLVAPGAQAQQTEGEATCEEPGVTSLAYGDHTVGCQISPGADLDNLQFEGTTGDRVRIIVHSTTSSSLDPRIELFDCGFVLQEETSCTSSFCVAAIDTELTCTGTHTILVSDLGSAQTGAYNLQLERLTPPHEQELLEYGAVSSDAVSPGTDIDRFSFFGKVGTRVRLAIHSTTSSSFDPRIEILGPDGQLVDDANCPNNFCSFTREFEPVADGFYSLFVSDDGSNEAGTYNLVINCIFGPCDSDGDGTPDPAPALLAYDEPTSAQLSPGVEIESYTVDVVAGTVNRLAVHSTTSSSFDPFAEIYDSTGMLVTTQTCANNFCSFVTELTPLSNDQYTIFVSDDGRNEAGNFNINLQCITGPCDSDGDGTTDSADDEAQFVFYDGNVSDAVSPGVDSVPYYFNGATGSVLRFAVYSSTSSSFDPRLEIFGPDGAVALDESCNNNFCAIGAELTLAMDGIYTVILSDISVNEAGTFDFNMQCIEGACDSDADGVLDGDPTIIPVDVNLSDAINPGVDVDQYSVFGETGKPLRITVNSTTSSSFDPQLEIVAPNGVVTVNSCITGFCGFTFDFMPAVTGLHQLILSDVGTNNAGSYDMLVSCLFANCSAPPPAPTDRDNCEWIANGPTIPDAGGNVQRDTDMDGYGNICDPDFDNNGVINFPDLAIMRERFFTTDPDSDLNGSGLTNFADLVIMERLFFGPPGPSGLQCAGTIPCP